MLIKELNNTYTGRTEVNITRINSIALVRKYCIYMLHLRLTYNCLYYLAKNHIIKVS